MKTIDLDKLKDKVKNIFKESDDSHEFLPIVAEIEEEPLNPLGRTMFWILITLITFTALWLFFGKADVVVSARGKVIPDGEIKIIQPLETGVIKKILVKEGDFVKKGQTLMEIDTSTTQPQLTSLKANLEYINIERARLRGNPTQNVADPESAQTQRELYSSSIADLQNQLQAKKLEIKSVDEEINNYKKQLSINLEKEARMKSVADIIAKNDLEKVHAQNIEYRSKIQELNHRKTGLGKEADYIRSNFKTQNFNELADRDKRANELKANIKEIEFRKQQQNIIAPVDGYVNTLLIHTVGGVVTPAQKLVSVVPADAPLIVKATVMNKDIGFIREGMPVLIKVDTFDFQKYGMLNGIVKKVSKDSVEDQRLGPIYDVYVTPLNKTLMVEGRETPITTGMSLTAEIKVNKRRIIEFFIYPMIKYWNQAIQVR
ncbi:MAG: HlyD family type I secretion periplasmic adaptor subunit [Candidatus Gastranaerophilales bacterium]|nr:HlyD family type I secretion periplasmic adaptor subunit [Candidatus Gastranaerophilales bacterium]